MENVPDRLLQVRNKDREHTAEQKIQMNRLIAETDAFEIILPYVDHTLGHVLKHELEQDPRVEYVSVKLPHPLEQKLVMRVFTNKPSVQVKDVFKDAVLRARQHLDQIKVQVEACKE